MYVQLLNPFGACSSAMFIELNEPSVAKSTDQFLKRMKDAIEYAESGGEFGYDLDNDNKYFFKDLAHVVISTSHKQKKTEEFLKEIGFFATERVKKNKNPKDEVTLWFMTVKKLLEVMVERGVL